MPLIARGPAVSLIRGRDLERLPAGWMARG